MTTNDHLDKEISVSADLTPTGVSAKANSRLLAAIDRLGGNLVELANAPLERRIATQRAKMEGETRLIKAAADYGVERMGKDEAFAARAFHGHFTGILRKQENKDAVLELALEDLQQTPSAEEDDSESADKLGEEFLSRFERYAEDAGTEELRAKWGKVLASEIRKPGTFSSKAIRIVDELDAATAISFERLCRHRIGNTIIKCLTGELPFSEQVQLVTSGLMVEPGLGGHDRTFQSGGMYNDKPLRFVEMVVAFAAVLEETPIPSSAIKTIPPIRGSGEHIGIPVYVLTDVGYAVASILEDHQKETFDLYMDQLSSYLAPAPVLEIHKTGANKGSVSRIIQKPDPAAATE